MKSIVLLALAACGSSPPPVTKATDPAALAYTAHDPLEPLADRIAAEVIADGDAAGVTVGIARGSDAPFVKAYGNADIAHKTAATRETVYRIGSLTKQFTAAAILQLVEAKKLSLDDDILLYAKVDTGGRIVKLRQLLNHTSGIPSYTDAADFATWSRTPHPPQDLVAHAAKMLWEFEPGSRFHYSNTGYVLLGMVIEKVSGQRYADYLRDHVFAPARMTSTRYCDDLTSPERALGYKDRDDGLVAADPLDLSTPFSAGALCSTVPDLLAWTRALASGKVISAAAFAAMTTPSASAGGADYGMGLVVDQIEHHRQVWHNGAINGFWSELHAFPDDHLAIVVLSNAESDAATRISRELSLAALGLPTRTVEPPPGELEAVAGTYDLPNIGPTVIAVRRHHLTIAPPKQGIARLEYAGGDTFTLAQPPVKLVFHHDPADNRITSVTIEQGGQKFDAMRVEAGAGSGAR